jgi:inner membrane transporter RhtA
MVWLRLITSAVVLLIMARPRLTGHSGRDWLIVLGFGVSLMIMNWSIYQSFARIPLGIAVTIEFFGPLAVAVVGSRRLIDLIWVVLAAEAWRCWDCRGRLSLSPAWGFALLAAVAWAGYILLSAQTGRCWPGLTGLAIASVVGATVLAPPAILEAGSRINPTVLALGVGVGLLSSVIPYSFELIALRRIPPRVFGILMSLEPAAAAIAGMLVLGAFLTLIQWLAMACVVIASIGATRASTTLEHPAPD